MTLKGHFFEANAFRRYHCFAEKNFSCRLCAGYQNNRRFLALAPPTLDTSEMFHDTRVLNPDIYGFAADCVKIRCI